MAPIAPLNNYEHTSTVPRGNDIQHTYVFVIQTTMIVFLIIHIIIHIERLAHLFLRFCLPASVYPALKDVLPSSASDDDYPTVAIQLPMLNEIECCEAIIECACKMDWPSKRLFIQVVDDSNVDEAKSIVDRCVQNWIDRGVQIHIHRRENNQGFKAGALMSGMAHIRHAEYIALFDADFLPTKDYLLKTVPILMHDSTIAFVQARWTFTNAKESFLTRMQEIILNFHHKCEQEGRYRASLFFTFNGTGGVWRSSAIEQVGGWNMDTLVEDLDLSLRAYLNGWRSVYMQNIECLNELPPTLSAYQSQQHRWISGPMQVTRKFLITICQTKHISWFKKIGCLCYLFRNFVHISSLISLIVILPIGILIEEWNIYSIISIYILISHSLCATIFTPNEIHLTLLYALFFNAMSVHNTCAMISGLFNYGLAKEWIVTPKFGHQTQDIYLMEKSTKKLLLDSRGNEDISIILKQKDIKKSCFYCLSFGGSLINDLFLKISRRMCQRFHSFRVYKRNVCMGIYLLVISYVTLRKQLYVTGIYSLSTAIMCIILAFSWIGRSK